jgi:hypothetical protein
MDIAKVPRSKSHGVKVRRVPQEAHSGGGCVALADGLREKSVQDALVDCAEGIKLADAYALIRFVDGSIDGARAPRPGHRWGR